MVDASSSMPPLQGCASPTPREVELLEVALEVLRENGFDRFTVDEVATRARASKTTLYRRWPSKSELVLAAFAQGVLGTRHDIDTGSLRGDLITLGNLLVDQLREHGGTIAGIMNELRSGCGLRDAFEAEFLHERHRLVMGVLDRALARGEIGPHAISAELWDVLPAYLIFRGLVPGRPMPDEATVVALVDDVLLPSLLRPAPAPAAAASR